jgi:peptidoglycan/LPS O-acetylase OafA/YrhL
MSHLPELCGGILLAFALKTRAIRCGDFLAVGALVALLVALPFVKSEGWWIYGAAAPVCLLLVAHLVTNRSSWISRAFAWRPAVWLGERSYGFYLWHYPVLLMLHLHHATTAVCVVIALPATLMLTELSWRVVEQPFLRLKRRYQVVRYDDGDDSHGGGFSRRHSSIRRVAS